MNLCALHEAALLSCAFLSDEVTDESIAAVSNETMALLTEWQMNGADPILLRLDDMQQFRFQLTNKKYRI